MAVKIRLKRRGRKKLSLFDVVVTDVRKKRDGAYIEKIGTYNPQSNPATIRLNQDSALHWLLEGAQPTNTVRAMLSYQGLLLKKPLQIGVRKQAITQEQADQKFQSWQQTQHTRIQNKVKYLSDTEQQQQSKRLAQETIVKEKRLAQEKESQATEPTPEPPTDTTAEPPTDTPTDTTAANKNQPTK